MQIKNTSDGPRGLYVDGTVVMLASGESRDDLKPTGGDLEAAKRSGWFEFEAEAKAEDIDQPPPPDAELDKLSDDELRGYLKDRGVEADGRWGRNRLLTEAEKAKAKG